MTRSVLICVVRCDRIPGQEMLLLRYLIALSPDHVYLQRSVAARQAVEGLLGVHQGGDGVVLKVILGEPGPGLIFVTNNLNIVAQYLGAEDLEHSCHKSEE